MFRRIGQYWALEGDEKSLFVHAWFLLGYYRAAILCVSFKRLTSNLDHHKKIPTPKHISESQKSRAIDIGRFVSVAARYTPWNSPCLAQVLVVKKLLAQNGIPGQFYLGVKHGRSKIDNSMILSAHAWLQSGETIVNGEANHELFTVVSTFSWESIE